MIMGFVFATIKQDGKLLKFYNTLEEAKDAAKAQDEVNIWGISIVDALNYLLNQNFDLSKLQAFDKNA